MGVWDWINSAIDLVKNKSPDVTPITEACRKGYDAGRAATVQVDAAVRTKARVLHDQLSDDQVRDNLTRVAKDVSKNGALLLARSYGVGPIIDVVSRSVQEKKVDSQKERIAALETKIVKLEKELTSRKVVEQEQAEIPKTSVEAGIPRTGISIPLISKL